MLACWWVIARVAGMKIEIVALGTEASPVFGRPHLDQTVKNMRGHMAERGAESLWS